jgi:protein-disulfide isomerase
MHDRLFASTSEWSGKENAVDVFKGYAAEIGLDVAAFASCLDSGETNDQMLAQYQESLARGISSVPAFYANDWFISGAQPFNVFQSTIEKALSGQHPPPTPTPLPEGKSFTDPNSERPGYTYGGDAFRGSETAEVLLFEFVNFGSADNRKMVLETWPDLQKKYVDSGKVRLMIKHLPTSEQPATVQAAEAAECAGQQRAFWEMFDLLFQRQDEWTKAAEVAATLKGYAAQLKIDAAAFATCLDQGQTKDKVQEDMDIGLQNQFPAAPVFFVFKGQEGGYVANDQLAQALEQFVAP